MSDVMQVVYDINNKLMMECDSDVDYFNYLELVCTPIGDYIKYMGQCIWDSENDYREWIDEDNQEPLETYLIREMDKVFEVVKRQLKVLCKKRKAVAKVADTRLKGEELRRDILSRTQQFMDKSYD